MAKCRICGVSFKESSTSGDEICHNEGCWKIAWNNAIAPFRKDIKVIETESRKNHRTSDEEKQQIIELYKQGKTRRQISDEVPIAYDVVCRVVRKYKED